MTVVPDIDGLQAKAKEKVAEDFTKESLRHATAMAALEDEYLKSFAAYRAGLQFNYEGCICTILEVQISHGFEWRNQRLMPDPDFDPNHAISYVVEELSSRYEKDQSRITWSQWRVKKVIEDSGIQEEKETDKRKG